MTLETERRLREAGRDIRGAVAALPEPAAPRRRRPVGALALAGAAALVVILALAVPALLRGDPEAAGPAAPPASPAPIGSGVTVVADADLGIIRVNSLTEAGDRLVLIGTRGRAGSLDSVVMTSDLAGEQWETVAAGFAADDLGPTAVHGDTLVAIGATGGASTTVYRSGDRGARWAPVALPLPTGHVQLVAQDVFVTEDGTFLAAGISTPTDFDTDVWFTVWSSPDGAVWTAEAIAGFGNHLVYAEAMAEVDGRVLLVASGSGPVPHATVFEGRPAGGWSQHDLAPIVVSQAGGSADYVNMGFIGAAEVDGDLHLWWEYGVMAGGTIEPAAAVARRSGDGDWEAKPLSGPVPVAVAAVDGGVVGLAPVAPEERYASPTGVLVVGSHAGVAWHELARFDDVALRRLVATGDRRVVAAGSRVGTGDPGQGVVRVLGLAGPMLDLIGGAPGG